MLKPRVDILLSEYERLKEYEKENQRLNNDIKILKENEAKEKVIIKYNNVLTSLYDESTTLISSILDKFQKQNKKLDSIKFYIEQSDIKNMLWGKEILEIIGDDKNEK